ncbi:hypothetical protein BJX99DRAFT_259018 [Aspergillus californicus]
MTVTDDPEHWSKKHHITDPPTKPTLPRSIRRQTPQIIPLLSASFPRLHLYAATYSVTNGTETITQQNHPSISPAATFICTFLANVPLGVWKDIKFAQIFGTSSQTDPGRKNATLPVPKKTGPAAATATLLVRDAITIFGSFTLAQRCVNVIPNWLASHPWSKTIFTHMVVPVLSQPVATPLHLLGLDLYNRQYRRPWPDRFAVVWRDLPSATAVRCVRIIPAFGFGCLVNMGLRSLF